MENIYRLIYTFLVEKKRKANFKTAFEKTFIRRIESGVRKIFTSKFINGVKEIKGTGFGLTPSGDDFLRILNKADSGGEKFNPKSIERAVKILPNANLALISVPGKYAAVEAQKALDNRLHVMIFSDHVSLEKEIELKNNAKEKGLLVMGPDRGTAIINGVPLAFANVVNRGKLELLPLPGLVFRK